MVALFLGAPILVAVMAALVGGAVSSGRFPKPRPFGGMGKPVDEDGFTEAD